MKREILFRGKRVDNGEWVEGFYGYKLESDKHFIMYEEINCNCPSYFMDIEVDPETLGEFTGLNDKNGKRIFEGDLLNVWIYKSYEVKFDSYNCQFNIGSYGSRNAEIIGSIHDNPELS